MSTGCAHFGHFAGWCARGVVVSLMVAVHAARESHGCPWRVLPARVRAWGCPGRDLAVSCRCRREGGGDAEEAEEGVEVLLGVAMAGDRGPRARDDRGQGIAERGPARGEAGPVTARGYDAERHRGVLAQVAGAGAQATPAAPHGRGRDAQLRAGRALPVPCRAAAAAARAITPAPSARRGAIQDGSSM